MSILDQAQWIWLNGCDTPNSYVDFKKELNLKREEPVSIELSVDGNYALYLNGTFINSGQYPDYPQYKVYDRLELTECLKAGVNELLIRVWWPGEDHFSYRAEKPGLLYAVYSGEEVLACSDETNLAARNAAFQVEDVPCLTPQLGRSFCYDARKAGREEFEPACVVEKEVSLYPRPIKKVEIGDRIPVKVVNSGTFTERPWETLGQRMQNAALAARFQMPATLPAEFEADGEDGLYVILDLGRESVGYPELELEVPEDALILCGYGEHLQDLRVRSYVGTRNFAFSYHSTAGKNHFFMPMRRLGLRYLQLHIYAPSAKIIYAGVRSTDYPLTAYPMEIKDRLHRKIYETCIHTLRCCMHDHYEDTPWREQGLYTMDSRNEILCGYDVFKETAFPKACLRLIALSVREDHLAELCSPARARRTIPSFSAIYLMELQEYLAETDDKAFLLEILPYAEKIAEGFAERIDPQSGLIPNYPDADYWNFYEWREWLDGKTVMKTYDAPLCALVSLAFQAMEKIYSGLGMAEKAGHYRALWQRLNDTAEKLFWNGEYYNTYFRMDDQTLFHGAQLTQALMICCGACPAEKLPQVRELLKQDDLVPVTLSYSIFKYDALMTDPGNLQWMLDDIAGIWGNMLFNGATSFWETELGAEDFKNAGSLCHGWSAVPLHLYHRYGFCD